MVERGWAFNLRVWMVAATFFVGFLGLATAVFVSFQVAIVAIVVIGAASSLGESVILGFLKNYPACAWLVGGELLSCIYKAWP